MGGNLYWGVLNGVEGVFSVAVMNQYQCVAQNCWLALLAYFLGGSSKTGGR